MPATTDSPLADRIEDLIAQLHQVRDHPRTKGVVIAVVLLAGGLWFVSARRPPAATVDEIIPQAQLVTTLPPTTLPLPLLVHVTGAVQRPGVYELVSGQRIVDAVEAAGGTTLDADPQQLNLAAPVQDGMQVRVPKQGEVVLAPTDGGDPVGAPAGPLNLNAATADQLDTLPGVGPSTANAIVAYREDHGPFASVQGLLEVPGIGPSKFDALKDLVAV